MENRREHFQLIHQLPYNVYTSLWKVKNFVIYGRTNCNRVSDDISFFNLFINLDVPQTNNYCLVIDIQTKRRV